MSKTVKKYSKTFTRPSRAKQEFADEVNINNVVKRVMQVGGELPQGNREPMFGDFSEVQSYQDAQNQIAQAKSEFEHLPLDVRSKFNYSITKLMDYLDDPANAEEAKEMGLTPVHPTKESTSTEETISESKAVEETNSEEKDS